MAEATTTERHRARPVHRHPTPRDYVRVAVALAIVTALEVSLFYVPIGPATIPALLGLMLIKFALVALWFMHLRFDSVMLRRVFVFGIVLALAVYGVVLWTFGGTA